MTGNGLHIIQFWLPSLVLVVLAACSITYWGVPIRLKAYGPDPGLTRGLMVLGLMGVVVGLMLIYWFLERRGVQLYPVLVWLHMTVSLLAVLGLCGGLCEFRTMSWFGSDYLDWGPGVVGFAHLTKSLFWFVVGQCVLIFHLLLAVFGD